MEVLRNIWNEEEGQGLVEYGLIIALIAVVLIAALGTLSGGLQAIFENVGKKLTNKAGSAN